MSLGTLVAPWLMLAAVLVPLVYAERWIHSHLFGVAWLATNSTRSATALYYVLLLPGVFVHEFTQYLVAGALNLPTERVIAWPEAQEDGTLRLNFVQVKDSRRLATAVIGAAPMLVGLAIVWLVSNYVLNLDAVLHALASADVTQVASALRDVAGKADFFLWLYLMFAVSNAMLPTPADRRGWPLLLGLFAGALVFLIVIGVGDVLLELASTSLAAQIEKLATALATVVLVELLAIVFIGFVEEVLERVTQRKFTYHREEPSADKRARTRAPGSSAPLPAGSPFPSIYNLELPVPLPTEARISAAHHPAPATVGENRPQPMAEAPAARHPPPVPTPGAARLSTPPEAPRPGTRPQPVERSAAAAPSPPARAPERPYVAPDADRTEVGERTGVVRSAVPGTESARGTLPTAPSGSPTRSMPQATSARPPAPPAMPPLSGARLLREPGDPDQPLPTPRHASAPPLRAPTPPQDDESDADDEGDDLEYVPFDDMDLT